MGRIGGNLWTVVLERHRTAVLSGPNLISVFNGATCNASVRTGCASQIPATVATGDDGRSRSDAGPGSPGSRPQRERSPLRSPLCFAPLAGSAHRHYHKRGADPQLGTVAVNPNRRDSDESSKEGR